MESVSEFLKMLLMVIVGGNEDGSKIMTLQPGISVPVQQISFGNFVSYSAARMCSFIFM